MGATIAFLTFNTINFAFTVEDLVKNEGSNAARILRRKADEYQAMISKSLVRNGAWESCRSTFYHKF